MTCRNEQDDLFEGFVTPREPPAPGIGQRVPDSAHHVPSVITTGLDSYQIRRKPLLGGLINEYARAA